MLDIDDFKKVNDVFGHGTGDQVLVALADDPPLGSIAASDVVCRIGGEEFAVIMPSCDAGDAMRLAARRRPSASPRRSSRAPGGSRSRSASPRARATR